MRREVRWDVSLFQAVAGTSLIFISSWHLVLWIYQSMFAAGNRNGPRSESTRLSENISAGQADLCLLYSLIFTKQTRPSFNNAIFCPFTLSRPQWVMTTPLDFSGAEVVSQFLCSSIETSSSAHWQIILRSRWPASIVIRLQPHINPLVVFSIPL
jgi:hypothetical protein